MTRTVYLAGSVAGCTAGEAKNWRANVSEKLAAHFIKGISPLRCEPLIGERYELSYLDPCFGTPKSIYSKNMLDVRNCDMVLCYMPKELNERRLSIGTLLELGWAHVLEKPTILVTDYLFLLNHPLVQGSSSWILATLDEAVETIVGVLGDYARPL